jgi:formate dehydrogenase major subunit
VVNVAIDGVVQQAQTDELLIELINHSGVSVPHVCYYPQLGPVQTCDTYMMEVNGRLIRACASAVADGMEISTQSAKAVAARRRRSTAVSAITCPTARSVTATMVRTVHNTTKLLATEHQPIPSRSKPSCKTLDVIFTHQKVETKQT